MRTDWSHLERFRVTDPGPWLSFRGEPFGAFLIKRGNGTELRVVASSGDEERVPWEHVSISVEGRCPTWAEMSYIKSLFWLPTETVMQLHVPDADHKNCHPYTLHLWRPLSAEIPRPPSVAVAP